MQNFINYYSIAIKNKNSFSLSAGDGKVSFVDIQSAHPGVDPVGIELQHLIIDLLERSSWFPLAGRNRGCIVVSVR
jgi:hypothetical protein